MPPQDAPQIYDIAPIPYFAGAPGLLAWATVLSCSAVLLYLAWRRILPQRATRISPAISNAVLRDIEAVRLALSAERIDPRLLKEVLAVLSISTRRAFGPTERFETLSAQQIEARIAELEAAGGAPPYSQLLQLLASIETYKYVPDALLREERERLLSIFQNFAREAKTFFGSGQLISASAPDSAPSSKSTIALQRFRKAKQQTELR